MQETQYSATSNTAAGTPPESVKIEIAGVTLEIPTTAVATLLGDGSLDKLIKTALAASNAAGSSTSQGEPSSSQRPTNKQLPPKQQPIENKPKLLISATFSAGMINHCFKTSFNGYFPDLELAVTYNDAIQQLEGISKDFDHNTATGSVNALILRYEDIFIHGSNEKNEEQLADLVKKLTKFNERSKSPFIICVTPSKKYKEQTTKLVNRLKAETCANTIISPKEIDSCYPVKQTYMTSEKIAKESHTPYDNEFFRALTMMLLRKYHLLTTKRKKVIAVDCDNTLWGGVVSDDGVSGITLNPDHETLQRFLLKKRDEGFLITLLSRNNEQDVLNVLRERPDMILREHHVTRLAVSWDEKSHLIQKLSKSLNLSLSSFIFIDDDKVQCAEVERLTCPKGNPQVLTLALPKDEATLQQWLESIWAFDALPTTDHSVQTRLEHYRSDKERKKTREDSPDFLEFIRRLRVEITPHVIRDHSQKNRSTKKYNDYIRRSVEILNRTNQFTFVKPERVVNQKDIQNKLKNGRTLLLFKVKDKFGKYGQCGVVVFHTDEEKKAIEIESFALSCRALVRGVEFVMLTTVAKTAKEQNIKEIRINLKATDQNTPAQKFMNSVISQIQAQGNIIEDQSITVSTSALLSIQPVEIQSANNSIDSESVEQNILIKKMSELAMGWFYPGKARQKTSATTTKNSGDALTTIITACDALGIKAKENPKLALSSLGMTSIVAAQLASTLLSEFNVKFSYAELIGGVSAEDIANLIKKKNKHSTFRKQGHRSKGFPLSVQQEDIWIDQKQNPSSNKYNTAIIYRIEGELNIDKLKESISTIVRREEVLRTVFEKKGRRLVQRVRKYSSWPLPFTVENCKHLKGSDITAQAQQAVNDPFDLLQGPLMRFTLFKADNNVHVFAVAFHHIIMDGTSFNQFISQLNKQYNQLELLESPRRQYIDYAASLSKKYRLSGSSTPPGDDSERSDNSTKNKKRRISETEKFWANSLQNSKDLKICNSQYSGQHPQGQSKRKQFTFNAQLTEKVLALSTNLGHTPYITLLSAYMILLSRFSSTQQVTVLTAHNGRDVETARMIGHFTKLFVFSNQVQSTSSFSEFSRNNRKLFSETFDHINYPYREMVKILRENSCEQIPYGFSLQDYETSNLELEKTQIQRTYADNEHILYDNAQETRLGPLAFYAQFEDNKLNWLVEYDTAVFTDKFISLFFGSYKNMLKQMVKDPENELQQYSLCDSKKDTIAVLPDDYKKNDEYNTANLIELFHEQTQLKPNSPAIEDANSTITYKELDQITDQLAAYIQSSITDLQKNDRIAVCIPRTTDEAIVLLAIVKLGCAYVPINIAEPTERIEYILRDTGAKICFYSDATRTKMTNLQYHGFKISMADAKMISTGQTSTEHTNAPHKEISNDTLAYVMYTSGSTGKPKGVMIEQRSIVRLVKKPNYIEFTGSDRIAQVSNSAFDAHTFEFWSGLLNGGTLVYPEKSVQLDPRAMSEFLNKKEISILLMVTTPLEQMITQGVDFSNLSYLIFGGEKAHSDSLKILFETDKKPKNLINVYGPTEGTVFATYHPVALADVSSSNGSIPIGRPVSGTKVYILDHCYKPLPVGIVGQLYLAGTSSKKTGLSRGYLNMPQKTADSFITVEIDSEKQRLYATGDNAFIDSNGNLHFISRIGCDRQFKLAGQRVELPSVEAAILRYPHIGQAVVIGCHVGTQGKKLCAYFSSNEEINIADLRQFLTKKLPQFMIPSYFTQMSKLPVNRNGKLDRGKLPDITLANQNDSNQCEHSPYLIHTIEGKIMSIFADILELEIEQLALDTDFREAGGTSIQLVNLLQRIEEFSNVQLEIHELEGACTPAQIKDHLKPKIISKMINNGLIHSHNSDTDPSKPVIVFLHPAGGQNICYWKLIEELKNNYSVFSIRDPSIESKYIIFDSITEIAEVYGKAIDEQLGERKITLAGWSFGGMVAYEILLNSKNTVSSIYLFDSWLISQADEADQTKLKKVIIERYSSSYNELQDGGFTLALFCQRQDIGFSHTCSAYEGSTEIHLFKATKAFSNYGVNINSNRNFWPIDNAKTTVYPLSLTHDEIVEDKEFIQQVARRTIDQRPKAKNTLFMKPSTHHNNGRNLSQTHAENPTQVTVTVI